MSSGILSQSTKCISSTLKVTGKIRFCNRMGNISAGGIYGHNPYKEEDNTQVYNTVEPWLKNWVSGS